MYLGGIEKKFKTNEIGEIIDFSQKDKYNDLPPLMFALRYYRDFNLSEEQLDYLIKNSNLKKTYFSFHQVDVLSSVLRSNIKLNIKTWKYLLDNSDLEATILQIKDDKESLNKLKKIQTEFLMNKISNDSLCEKKVKKI